MNIVGADLATLKWQEYLYASYGFLHEAMDMKEFDHHRPELWSHLHLSLTCTLLRQATANQNQGLVFLP